MPLFILRSIHSFLQEKIISTHPILQVAGIVINTMRTSDWGIPLNGEAKISSVKFSAMKIEIGEILFRGEIDKSISWNPK